MNIAQSKKPSLLSRENCLTFSPTLAVLIGDRQAILLQQVQYWLDHNERDKKETHFKKGRWWTYNTYENWRDTNFPFWSVRTIRRLVSDLEKLGLLISEMPYECNGNHTKWYSIDYDAVYALTDETIDFIDAAKMDRHPRGSNPPKTRSTGSAPEVIGNIDESKVDRRLSTLDKTYNDPETTPEITQEEYRKVFPEETTSFNNSIGENNQEGEPPTPTPPVDISDYRQPTKPEPPKPLYKGESELDYDEHGWIQLPTTRGTASWMRQCCSYARVQTMSWIKEWMINSYPEALDLSFGHNHAGETIVRMFDGSWTPYEQFVSPNGPMPAKVMRDLLSARMPLFIHEFNEQTQAYWDEAWENFKYLIALPCVAK